MEADSTFRWVDLADSSGYTLWEASPAEPSSPIEVRIDNTSFNARSPLRFLNQQPFPVKNGVKGLGLVFHDPTDQFEFVLHFEIHPGHPVLHHQLSVKNLHGNRVFFRANYILPYSPKLEDVDYRVFCVN